MSIILKTRTEVHEIISGMMQTVSSPSTSSQSAEKTAVKRWDRKDWQVLALIAGLAIALFLPGLGAFGVIDPSEAYYSESGREMLEMNEWITPLLNYQLWHEKPALTYWLIALSYKALGVSEFAARLPSALLAIALALFTYSFTRQFLRRRASLISTLILLTCPLYMVVGHLSLTDMPFTTCVTVTLFSFLGMLTLRSGAFFWPAYVFLGLGALAKGPLAFILCGLVASAYIFVSNSTWKGRFQSVLALKPLPGLALAALVAVPWYVAVCVATKGAFAQEFFLRQNFGRAAGTADHRFPPWFYLPYLFGGAAPWSIILLSAPAVLRRFAQAPAERSRRAAILKFAAVWSALVFVVLSLVPSKLPTYILPVWPALAILLGTALDTTIRLNRAKRLRWTGPTLTAVGIGALALMPMLLRNSPQLLPAFAAGAGLVTVAMIVYAIALFKQKAKLAVTALMTGVLLGTAILVPMSLQAFWCHHQQGFRQILETVKLSSASTALFGPIQSSTFYYLRRHVPYIKEEKDVDAFVASTPGPHWLIIIKSRFEDLEKSHRPMTVLEHHRAWYLVSLDDNKKN